MSTWPITIAVYYKRRRKIAMGLLETAFSPESLHNSFMEIRKDIHFKYDVQYYRINELKEINKFRKAYANGTFEFSDGKPFTIKERGKARYIRPDVFRDRVVIHAFCKYILLKELRPYFIYDNHASLKGKGIDKQIERTCVFLNKYYNKFHTNKGYILQIDITKYFDNIRHEKVIEMISEKINDKEVIDFLTKILKRFEIDVSYLLDEEYENSMNDIFNSLTYNHRMNYGKTKMMKKSVSIGNEVSQTIGLFYLYKIDNYAKIVLGFKYYGRYMDDILVISNNKEDLEKFLLYVRSELLNLGLYINEKKTHINKLSDPFIFLKTKFIFKENGEIILSKKNDTFIRERRKLKKLYNKYENDELAYNYIESQYSSWRGAVDRKKKINNIKTNKNMFKNKRQINEMDLVYNKLFEDVINGEPE